MLGLFAFFYAVLHFLAYLYFDQQFDLKAIWGDIAKRRYITVGFLSWVCMAALAITSTAGWVRRMGVQSWQRLHKLVYLSGFAAVIHYYWLVKSDIRLPAVYGAILAVLLLARLPSLSKKKVAGGFRVTLAHVHHETDDAVTLTFALPPKRSLAAKPGQFLTFDWMVNGQKLSRSYSISSAPQKTGYFDITVKKQGVVSTFLNETAREGLEVVAYGPYGRFYLDGTHHVEPVFFAGGSGITPILSMLLHLETTSPDSPALLFYACRDDRQIIFRAELERLAQRLPRLRVISIISQPSASWTGERGLISEALVARELGSAMGKTFFLCGPPPFMSGVKEILRSLGAASSQILQERFTAPAAPPKEAERVTCTVEFAKSGRRLECTSADLLLSVAERNGIEIPASCRVGQCGTCATRILSGDVEMESDEGLSPVMRAEGFILLCVGRARGLVTIDA